MLIFLLSFLLTFASSVPIKYATMTLQWILLGGLMWVSIHTWLQVDAPMLRLRGAALYVGHGGRQGSPRGSGTAGMGSM
jgi:hypothetical protein